MTKLGYNSQLAVGEESTYGVRAVPGRTVEFVSESLSRDEQRIESNAITKSAFRSSYGLGQRQVGGDLELELGSVGQGIFFHHALGKVTTVPDVPASGVTQHTYTPGILDGLGLTVQVSRGGVPFDYLGCKVAQLKLSCSVGDIAKLSLDLVAQDEDITQTEAVESFPAGNELLTFVGADLMIDGAPVGCVQSAEITLSNSLKGDRFCWGRRTTKEPIRDGFLEVSGNFEVDFEDLTHYQRYIDGGLASAEMRFDGVHEIAPGIVPSLVITSKFRTDGATPTVNGPGELKQSINFKAFPGDGGSDADALTIVQTTLDLLP